MGARYRPHGGQPKSRRVLADGDKVLDVDRYEFLLYRLLRNALEAGNLYVKDSVEFRRFEDDLISDERWENKAQVLQEIGAQILLDPIEETLAQMKGELETKIEAVNQRIADAVNQHIKVSGRGEKRRWQLLHPSEDEPVNSPFFGKLPGVGIADLLRLFFRNINTFSVVCLPNPIAYPY